MTFGDESALEEIDSLHWRAFEELVAELFARRGYATECVGGRRDHGADIIAVNERERVAIQVKHRSGRRWIGEQALRAVVTARPVYDCNRAIVVTNATFAPGLQKLADLHGVELWDGDRLDAELLSFCVLCGGHVSERVRDWCLDRPDEFRGRVYCFGHQRNPRGVLRVAEPV